MTGESQRRYSFGDSPAAAERLEYLAELFRAPSRSLLRTVAGPVGLAVDLGCGPGFTTRLLAEELSPQSLAGLDISESFLARARASGTKAAWHHHDTTRVPFPTGPADVLYARLVLAHLPRPGSVLQDWVGQLRPGGRLLVEETEHIVIDHPVLRAYEDMAGSLVAHRGGDLYVGRRLAETPPPDGTRVVLDRSYHHVVPVPAAARLFGMNFRTWRSDTYITGRQPAAVLDDLAAGLGRASEPGTPGEVDFVIRQLVYLRTGPVPGHRT